MLYGTLVVTSRTCYGALQIVVLLLLFIIIIIISLLVDYRAET